MWPFGLKNCPPLDYIIYNQKENMRGFTVFTINDGLGLGGLLLLLPQRLGCFQFIHLLETTALSRHRRVMPRPMGLEKSEG